ncbi:discoidin domain-containing protein [Catellatospora citrea]|uniref:F5/8 type C domain-containing protein n=1 Tax=Catellatospora citrea TaxID=53366 RepID=A0A8J3NZZ5_9ACTN|nr:discoidin domain-containing protein [Catellatospora citrea]RKE05512.1 RHS repeat-associated protein [Catellatospora citrea]GIF96860.1 hypothetical protein Cci01nite_19540 [Catellatospora citrea]
MDSGLRTPAFVFGGKSRRPAWRRALASLLAASVAATLLVAGPPPVSAAEPDTPGGSAVRPRQQTGSAAGREHEVAASQTNAPGSVPSGDPTLPPGAKNVVGKQKRYPEPEKAKAQCIGCPPGTIPVPQPPGAKGAKQVQTATLSQPEAQGFVEGKSTEVVSERAELSTQFKNPDGTQTARFFSSPTFAKNAAGAMVPIDTSLAKGAGGRFEPRAAVKTSFGPTAADPRLAALSMGDVEVAFGVENAVNAAAATSGAEARYDDLAPGADLILEATPTGFKDKIILDSVASPTTWRFPLELRGLTPTLLDGGRIIFKDAKGEERAYIPPGFMFDATPDPKTGQGKRSNGVTYRLLEQDGRWVLELTLDKAWLNDPERRFPVTVDPPLSVRETRFQDTFVSSKDFANRDNGGESFLKVGTYNGGVEKSASYISFQTADPLSQKYIVGASLVLHQTWARSCTNATLYVHNVTQNWLQYETAARNWPGPAYESSPIGQKSFNRGGNCTSKPAGREDIPIDPARFRQQMDFLHGWYGFTLRASNTDNNAEKLFKSGETGAEGPFLDVTYSIDGAAYSLPSTQFDPPVTPSNYGFLDVKVTNLGYNVWPKDGNYNLWGYVRNSAGTLVETSVGGINHDVMPLTSGYFPVIAGPLPAGDYTIELDMRKGTADQQPFSYWGVTKGSVSFRVLPEATPEIVSIFPANNAQVDTLTPTLWAQYYDADLAPGGPWYYFEACNGTPSALVDCQNSGWISSSTWRVPPNKFTWGKTSFWRVAVWDEQNMSYLQGPYAVTPVVPQPEITSHLAAAPENPDISGVNPQVGNFSTETVDASIPAVGPPLEIRRTYNSQDFRGNGADYNLALGKAGISSVTCSANEPPAQAFNGSVSGGLTDKWCSSTAPTWLQVDLGGVQTVRSFVVRHAGAGGEAATLNTKNFNFQVSTDGTTWTTAATVTNNTANVTTTTISATSARFVKLNITTPTQTTNTAARVYEFEVMGNDGAFGAGWSTPLNQRITNDPDGSGNVVVTLPTGQQVRFGRNPDGSYAPPPGFAVTLKRGTADWTLRDATGEKRVFSDLGRLTSVTDADGRQQQYTYTNGRVTQIKDLTSSRTLDLTWTDGRVTTVKANAPVAGAAQPTWTYTYSGNQLQKVCGPMSSTACQQYQYESASHYRSVVIDDNPVAYYPMNETSGGKATNIVARKPGEFDGAYTGVTLGQTGALAGTTDKAASFTGTSRMLPPDNLLTTTMGFSVEMWFKAASGKTGVLYGEQNTSLNQTPARWSPALYVGTDGKLHGKVWSTSNNTQVVSTARVDNGAWHHVVLTVNVDKQDVYLDGVRIGQVLNAPAFRGDMSKASIGTGYTPNWAAAGTGYFPFTGQIDEVALYRHALGPLQVSAHYAARVATSRMNKVIEPNTYVSSDVTYDSSSGRVNTVRDRHGATWTVEQPILGDGTRTVALSSTGRDKVTYTYDAEHGGRLMSRATGDGTEQWEYDANGFVTEYTDANGRPKSLSRDARGNVTWEGLYQGGLWRWQSFGYYLNAADPLDPRNDRVVWRSGTRTAWDSDPKNRIVFELDTSGRTTRVTHPLPAGSPTVPVEQYTYTDGTESATGGGLVPAGLVERYVNPLGGTVDYSYNSRGDLTRSVSPLGMATDYTYDLLGRSVGRTDSAVENGTTVTYGTWLTEYNDASWVTVETSPGVQNPITSVLHTPKTTYTYNESGRLHTKTVADFTGADPSRVWTYDYDPAGRPTSITTPDTKTETREWNTAGDVSKITKPNGLITEYRYDDARRLTETIAIGAGVDPVNPLATQLVIESRAYDPSGQLATVVDAIGRETAYTYHTDGLVATEKRVRRDAQGEIASVTQLAAYEYDYAGKVIRVTGPNGVTQDFDYDDAGLRNRVTIDAAGVARTAVRTFAPDGSVAAETRSNGFHFLTGRNSESAHLFSAGGSQLDGAGSRYSDGSAAVVYKFVFPADAVTGTVDLEIDNQYLVQFSSNNTNWTEVARETRDIRDGSNRLNVVASVDSYLQTSKTLYVKVGDSQPANGWGGALSRVSVQYTRTGEAAAKTTYGYDNASNLLTETVHNPGGTPATLATTHTRDARGLIKQTVGRDGVSTGFTYDAAGHLRTTLHAPRTVWVNGIRTDDFAPVETLGRNVFGEVTDNRAGDGAVVTTTYDAMGRTHLVQQPSYTPPGGSAITPVTTTLFEDDGQPATVTDPLGRVTSYDYDLFGRLLSKTLPDPDGTGPLTAPRWDYSYDRAGELLQTFDPAGARVSATYNDLGHQVTSTQAERTSNGTVYFTTKLNRDNAGLLTSVESPLGHLTVTDVNKAGETTKITDATGLVTESRYDAQGRLTAELTGAIGTSYRYDAAGRMIAVSDHTVTAGVLQPALRTQTATYDGADRPVKRVSAEGRVTDYAYDAGGNLTSTTQRSDQAVPATAINVKQGFDASGRRTRLIDGNLNVINFVYNSWGALTSFREPDLGGDPSLRTWTNVYDAAGQQVSSTAPGGVTRTRTFDDLGRMLSETGAGAEAATTGRTTAYDALGRVTNVSDPAGDQTYAYNDRGLLTRSTGADGETTYTYDDDGNLRTRVGAAGTGTFTYDDADRLKTAADPVTGNTLTYQYVTTTGLPESISYGTGKPSRGFQHDNLGRLTQDTIKNSSGGVVLSTAYGYDRDDLVTSRDTTGYLGAATNAYGYDGVGRLKSWTKSGTTVTYGYDLASNRTSTTTSAGTRTSTFDARNRLVSATGGGQPDLANTWSPRGTLVSTTIGTAQTQYSSDAFDQPVVATAGSSTVTYSYDALDRLTKRNGAALTYADLTNNPVTVPTGTGQATTFRAPDGSAIADKHGTGTGRLVIADQLRADTVAAIAPDTGAAVASRSYDPDGVVTQSSGDFASGFQGGWVEPSTGQVNAHARWYDPGLASFSSRDSVDLGPDPLPQINRYAYGNANPTTFNDPTGQCPVCAIPLWQLALWAVAAIGTYAVVDHWAKSGAAEDAIRSLYALGNAAVTSTLDGLRAMGMNAYEALREIQVKFSNNAQVQAITNGIVGTPAVTIPTPTVTTPALPAPTITLPAVGSTITNSVPPSISLLPAGQLLQNSITVSAAITVPSILIVNADGTEVATAATAATVVTEAAMGMVDTSDPSKCDSDPETNRLRAALKAVVEAAAEEVIAGGLAGVDALMTDNQRNKLAALRATGNAKDASDADFLESLFRGNRIHVAVRDILLARFPKQFRYRSGGKNNAGPDFPHRSGLEVELTTPGEVPAHSRRDKKLKEKGLKPLWEGCVFALYNMPTS